MLKPEEEVFDWAAYEPRQERPVEVYRAAAAVQVPPAARVVAVPGQVPYYAHQAAPLPPYDPLPARMYGCGVMAFGILAGAGITEAGSYWMFAGMALATHALIGLGALFMSGAIAVVALRMSSGVRIDHFHQGDNSTFRAGR